MHLNLKHYALFLLGVGFLITARVYAFDSDLYEKQWHTATGKSYTIYEHRILTPQVPDKKAKPGKFFIISYQTQENLDKKELVAAEMYDVMAHLYHFYIPQEIKKKSFSEKNKYLILLRAYEKDPKKNKEVKVAKIKKKLNDVESIAKYSPALDWTRLRALRRFNANEYEKAIQVFGQIKNKVPHDYALMAQAYLNLKKYSDAKKTVEEGLKLNPTYVLLWHQQGKVALHEGSFNVDGKFEFDPEKMKEAKKSFEKAVDLKKDYYVAYVDIATVETALGNYSEAEKILKNLISKSSKPWFLNKTLADMYVLWKKKDLALKHYEAALKINPREISIIEACGEFQHRESNYKAAEKYYQLAIDVVKKRGPASQVKDALNILKAKMILAQQNKPLPELAPAEKSAE